MPEIVYEPGSGRVDVDRSDEWPPKYFDYVKVE